MRVMWHAVVDVEDRLYVLSWVESHGVMCD
jgi:hypothetical protein